MAWQIIAIALIVGAALIYFVQSEKRQKADVLSKRARHFATAPAYRHRSASTAAQPAPVISAPNSLPVGLSPSDRQFLVFLARQSDTKSDQGA